jgi:hypothetical protein
MGTAFHGKNAAICVNDTAITGANAWALQVDTDNAQTTEFGTQWKITKGGTSGWSGSLTLDDLTDISVLFDAAAGGAGVVLFIYPTTTDLADYYTGTAIFSWGAAGDTASIVSKTSSFVGDGTLTQTGYAA